MNKSLFEQKKTPVENLLRHLFVVHIHSMELSTYCVTGEIISAYGVLPILLLSSSSSLCSSTTGKSDHLSPKSRLKIGFLTSEQKEAFDLNIYLRGCLYKERGKGKGWVGQAKKEMKGDCGEGGVSQKVTGGEGEFALLSKPNMTFLDGPSLL